MNRYLNLSKKMLYKLNKFVVLLYISVLLGLLCSCTGLSIFSEENNSSSLLPQPIPNDGIKYTATVTLYYRFMDTEYLAPLDIDIDMLSNERPEVALLRALFSGKGEGVLFNNAIPDNVELVSIVESGNTLFITLSKELINSTNYDNCSISVAVSQIVNTITKYSNKTVQIMIDREGNGSGDRVSYTDLGFDKSFDKLYDYAAPFSFLKKTVITPSLTLNYVLSELNLSNSGELAPVFAANSRKYSITSSDIYRFTNKYHIKSFKIINEIVHDEFAEIQCSIKYESKETKEIHEFEGIIEMPCYGRIYKIPYEQIVDSAGGM